MLHNNLLVKQHINIWTVLIKTILQITHRRVNDDYYICCCSLVVKILIEL